MAYGTIFEWYGHYDSLNDSQAHREGYGNGTHMLYMALGEDDRCHYIGAAMYPELPDDIPPAVEGTRIYFGAMVTPPPGAGPVFCEAARDAAKQALICVLLAPNPDLPHPAPDDVMSVFSCFYNSRGEDGALLAGLDDAPSVDPPGVPRVPILVGFNWHSGQWFVVTDPVELAPPAPPLG